MDRRKVLLLAFLFTFYTSLAVLNAAPVSLDSITEHQADEVVESARDRVDRILSRYGDVLIGIMIPVGLIFAVAGYRLLKPTLFVAGFFVGGFLVYFGVYYATRNTSAGAWAPILAFFLGGIALGLIAMFLVNLGIFVAGAALGVVLALVLRSLFATISSTNTEWAFYIFLGAMALVFGILAVFLKRPIVILATSLGGSFGFIYGIGHFAGDFPLPHEFFQDEDLSKLGWEVWVLFGAWLLLSAICVVVQFKWTSKKKKDTESFHATQKNGVVAPHRDDGLNVAVHG